MRPKIRQIETVFSQIQQRKVEGLESENMATQKIAFPREAHTAEANSSNLSYMYPKVDYARQSSESATPNSLVVTGTTTGTDLSEQAIRDELPRLLASPIFVHSNRLARFLRFTVETTLAGQAETLKEYVIGTEVYDRKPPYQPTVDSIVRTEARRLRKKLKEYYESVGQHDPVFIYYRPGSYVPVFLHRRSKHGDCAVANTTPGDRCGEERTISVGVLPFVSVSRSHAASSGACAQIVTDALIHELVQTEGFRVSAPGAITPLIAQAFDLPSIARKLDLHFVFEGVVHEDNCKLRIMVRIVAADGFLIWSERFETEPDTPSFAELSEQISSALISRVAPDKSSVEGVSRPDRSG